MYGSSKRTTEASSQLELIRAQSLTIGVVRIVICASMTRLKAGGLAPPSDVAIRRSTALFALPLAVALASGLGTPWAHAEPETQGKKTPVKPADLDDEPLVSDEDMLPSKSAADATGESEGVTAEGKKVLVLPYQPIFRSAEPDKTQLATELVVQELAKQGGMVVVRGGVAKEGTQAPSDDSIQALLKAADDAEAAKDLKKAIEARKAAIAEIEKTPSAVEDASVYIGAHHQLARALFWSAQDSLAVAALDVAARMDPNFELKPSEYSRFYRSAFRQAAQKALQSRTAEILVRSALPGAKILLDGRDAKVAPVRLESALPGKHILHARIDGVPQAGLVVTLRPGKNREVTVSFDNTWGGVAVGAVADAIAENKIPEGAVKKAIEAGKEAGVEFVVAGGMAQDKVAAKFNVHTFVVNVASGGIAQLPMTNFDLDMLTAASDVIRIVRAVEDKVKDYSDAKRAISSIESKVRPIVLATNFNAKPTLEKRSSTERSRRSGRPSKRRVFKAKQDDGIKDD